jgi:hypothetical protein
MSSKILFRWSGLATILGGALLPISWILRFVFSVSRPYTGTIEFVATILLVFGFMGVYGFQHEQSGVLGFLGFVFIIIHSCAALGECWLQNGELTGAATVLAPIVGITMLPRWAIVLWVIGGLLIVPGFAFQPFLVVIGGVIQGIGVVATGVTLWMGKY